MWQEALKAWIQGYSSSEVIGICGRDGVNLLQEALTYRLPWAMEAVRVHASAVSEGDSGSITGLAALAVEAGSSNQSVILLLRSGLSSRDAAVVAVASTNATFKDRAGMLIWLDSDLVKERTNDDSWPTDKSHHAWIQFYQGNATEDRQKWKRERQQIAVEWTSAPPIIGTHVVLESIDGKGLVMSPSYSPLGTFTARLNHPRRDIVEARVAEMLNTIAVEYFGPGLHAQ